MPIRGIKGDKEKSSLNKERQVRRESEEKSCHPPAAARA